jgi:hypothetical protein
LRGYLGDPLKGRHVSADNPDTGNLIGGKEETLKRLRRLALSLGAVAAFLMAAGAGWKS